MKAIREAISIHTEGGKPAFVNITSQVQEIVDRSGVTCGICLVYSHHTTCSVLTQECAFDMSMTGQETLQQDLCDILDEMVPVCKREGQYLHPGPKALAFAAEHGEDARGCHNTDAHLRSLFLGRSETIPLIEGRLDTGEFGYIYFADLDQTRERDRTVMVQIIGE